MKDKDKERIKKFIELQNKDLKFEDIASYSSDIPFPASVISIT